MILAVLIVALSFVCIYLFFFLSRPGRAKTLSAKDDSCIRVATVNINSFRFLSTPEDAAAYILKIGEDKDIDIILLQEYFQSRYFSDADFKNLLSEGYPYVITVGEHAAISRFPILNYKLMDFDSSDNSYMTMVMDINGQQVKVISTHLQTTGIHSAGSENRDVSDAIYILKGNQQARESQALCLREEINSSSCPVIVAGDFNSVPYSKVYRIVKQHDMKDCFLEKGRGSGSTYREMKDKLRIDYIMHDTWFKCVDCVIADEYISDHRMVISTLRFI